MKFVLFGGGVLQNNSFNSFKTLCGNKIKFYQTYGCTECGPRITTKQIGDKYDSSLLGYPLENVEIFIENKDIDGYGDVRIKTPTLFLGYLKNGILEKANESFYPGDIARLTNKGELEFKCRKNNILKYNGFNIIAEEIENSILNGIDLDDLTVRLLIDGNDLTLQIESKEKNIINLVREYCNTVLPLNTRPTKYVIVDKIKRTHNNKIKR